MDNAGIEPASFCFAEPTLKLSKITGWLFCDFRFTLTGVQLNHSNPDGLPSSFCLSSVKFNLGLFPSHVITPYGGPPDSDTLAS